MTGYRERTYALVKSAVGALGPISSAVDVGAGDGWYAQSLVNDGIVERCAPVDVVRRAETVLEPQLYDGRRLPFADRSFDLAYAVDVVHHAGVPAEFLGEMARVARRWIVLKDHTYSTPLGWLALAGLDQLGNRRFGIPSPGRYQRGWEWLPTLRQAGFEQRRILHPAPCQVGLLGALTNRWQFVAAFERTHAY